MGAPSRRGRARPRGAGDRWSPAPGACPIQAPQPPSPYHQQQSFDGSDAAAASRGGRRPSRSSADGRAGGADAPPPRSRSGSRRPPSDAGGPTTSAGVPRRASSSRDGGRRQPLPPPRPPSRGGAATASGDAAAAMDVDGGRRSANPEAGAAPAAAAAAPPAPPLSPAASDGAASADAFLFDDTWARDEAVLEAAAEADAARHAAGAPPAAEPRRGRDHRDHLLAEAVWLAKEFQKERKWKAVQAKKFAWAVSRSGKDVEARANARVADAEAGRRRVAAGIAKDVARFWEKAARVALYKFRAAAAAARKGDLDRHLEFVVGQTARYSASLAARLGGVGAAAMPASSLASGGGAGPSSFSGRLMPATSGPSAPRSDDDEGDYVASGASEADDEATLEEEERLAAHDGGADARAEADALAGDADLPIEVLLARYGYVTGDAAVEAAGGGEAGPSRSPAPPSFRPSSGALAAIAGPDDAPDEEGGDDYCPSDRGSASGDDEATLEEEERLAAGGGADDAAAEAAALAADADLPIEELMARYGYVAGGDGGGGGASPPRSPLRSPSQSAAASAAPSTGGPAGMDLDADAGWADVLGASPEPEAPAAPSLLPTGGAPPGGPVAPRPFLLKHALRDYQQAGLDWLASIGDRRINGILADEVGGDGEGVEGGNGGRARAGTTRTASHPTPLPLLPQMGLGKTIMTIALLAHLACSRGVWGPHLIVVPTSVMLNWEVEFKKWCPAFKLLTYYGSVRERRAKRQGWSRPGAFHVCITR